MPRSDSEPSPAGSDAGSRPARILIVDDDESIRQTLQEALREANYEVATASNGSEALGVLERWRPDLVLLDLVMPRMNAWTFAEAYRNLPYPRAPILLVTAAGAHAEKAAQDIGAADVVIKPYNLADLLDLIAYFLHYLSAD